MTATARPPVVDTTGPDDDGARRPRTTERRPSLTRRLASDQTALGTIALTALTMAVAVGGARLFRGGDYVGPIVVTTLVAHAVAWWCRRNDLTTGVAAVATLGATTVVVAMTVLGDATAYGIPIPHTFRVALDELDRARTAFQSVKAPTPALPGFVVALCMAIGVTAFMADWAAFRLHTAIEALVPSFTLFVFTAAVGASHYRMPSTVAFVAAALGFVVVFNLTARSRLAWFGGTPGDGPGSVVRAAAALGALAIGAGLVIGPGLPGAGSAPIVKYKNRAGSGPSSRVTTSPLVDIRGRLVERADVEVFTVESNQRAYWRLTSLDTFNGSIWSSNTTYRPTKGGLATAERLLGTVPSTKATQSFRIRALDSIWLPHAYRPQRIEGIDDVSYNPDTASLITDEQTTDGFTYSVTSAVPQLTPELLDTAPAQAPQAIADRYLPLPQIPERVRILAQRIISGRTTPYQQARALQDFFRSGAFTYDLNVEPRHDRNALVQFLFLDKRGYCEQFAGAYAVMARSLGLPTRIAVGFTPGVPDENGRYSVRDEHAHAWPEVYLDGFGWVAFEPTPGRGAPNAESYTGQPEAQDTSGPASAATTVAPSTTAAPGAETPSTVAPDPGLGAGGQGNQGDQRPERGAMYVVMVGLAAFIVLWCTLLPLLHLRRIRKRRRATEAADRVLGAWAEATEVLAQAGVRRRPSETLLEFSNRAPASAGLQRDAAVAFRDLGSDTAYVTYAGGPGLDDDGAGERAAASARAVRDAIGSQVSLVERVRWWLDPRPLWREWRSRAR